MYKLIYKPTGNCMNEYDTWRSAQEICGLLIDDKVDCSYKIEHWYNKKFIGEYELKDFVARTQPDNFTLDTAAKNIKDGLSKSLKPAKDLERERFHNLDDKETAEVLKYTPTGALIGELARRANEYESTVDNIYKLLDSMKVYDIKH